MSKKKRRHYNGPPKGAVVIYQRENPPDTRFAHQWFPPKGSAAYFLRESDFEFQRRHPVGYVFAVLLGIFALLLPVIVYGLLVLPPHAPPSFGLVLGLAGGFIFGIGLFNFVAIILHQYLGHLVSILCFLIGGAMMAVSVPLIG
ncbi:MAG: hypothetical protein IJ649_00915 [Oscillospiraceae bacterium]|nr:hypothetical protein [Oscillospiraceae bacterium]